MWNLINFIIYLIGVVLSWFIVRKTMIDDNSKADGWAIFLVLCPIVNFVTTVVLFIYLFGKKRNIYDVFFLMPKDKDKLGE